MAVEKNQKNFKKTLDEIYFVWYTKKAAEGNSKMESWLSGRRRTTGNRVTVMSGSRVQIPDSPP